MKTLKTELSGGSKRYVTARAPSVWPCQLGGRVVCNRNYLKSEGNVLEAHQEFTKLMGR